MSSPEEQPLLEKEEKPAEAEDDTQSSCLGEMMEPEGLRRMGCMLGGVCDDYKRRAEHYLSDWTDAASLKTLSATIFIYVATVTSTLALGVHINEVTHGKVGVSEYLIMNFAAGVIYSVISCQPLVVLRPTGPITLVVGKIYTLSEDAGYDFYAFLAWTGMFVGIYMFIIAAFEVSRFCKYTTPFVEEIFAFFVCSIYVYDGIHDVYLQWEKNGDRRGECLMSTNFTIGIVVLALWFSDALQSRFFSLQIRRALVDYALFLGILIAAIIAKAVSKDDFQVFFVEAPGQLSPTSPRPWQANFANLGVGGVFVAVAMALPITLFFYVDQNISSVLTQKPEMRLRKGSYYHSSFWCLGILNVLGPLFGLPFVTGSLPHSPQFVISLATIDVRTMVTTSVCENRVAPILSYCLMLLPLLYPHMLTFIPHAAISSTLIFVGLQGMVGTELYARLLLVISDPNLYPQCDYTKVPFKKMHLYTLTQILCWAGCWVANLTLGLAFPAWIACLFPIRAYLIPKLFTKDELSKLDHQDLDGDAKEAAMEAALDQRITRGSQSQSKANSRASRFSLAYQRP